MVSPILHRAGEFITLPASKSAPLFAVGETIRMVFVSHRLNTGVILSAKPAPSVVSQTGNLLQPTNTSCVLSVLGYLTSLGRGHEGLIGLTRHSSTLFGNLNLPFRFLFYRLPLCLSHHLRRISLFPGAWSTVPLRRCVLRLADPPLGPSLLVQFDSCALPLPSFTN